MAAIAFALCSSQIRAAGPAFSLDSILAAPFVDDLVAAPHRDALAWTLHERGTRNVVVWKGGVTREVTHSRVDDGEELDSVGFVPEATAVVYERGGSGQDGDDANPNPAAPAKREPRKILLTSVESGATIALGNGIDPAVSPRGDRVAWVGTNGQVWSATIASHDGGKTWIADKAAELFTVRGTASLPLWSPDGERIAITDRRGDHSYVAMYTFGSPTIVFAAPAFSSDQNPTWSPDGTRIAFLRLPGTIQGLTQIYDDPARFPPWSIVVADAVTGKGGIVWEAPRGRGYEFTIADGVQPIWWSRNNHLAFVWERDGWRHLYAIPATGGPPQLLTPGNFEIEQIALGASGNDLLYTSNAEDLASRHVWRVTFGGGAPVRLTSGPTNQWSPVDLIGGAFAAIDASYNVPGTVTLETSAATSTLAPHALPVEYPKDALVEPKTITFAAPDGLTIHGQLFLAHDGRVKHPALIFVHGGPERQMLTTYHYFEAYTNLYELNQYLVSCGFDVLSVNYRSGIMYGHDFFEPPGRGWLGASEYQDVLAGARVLAARPDVDATHLGIYGLSYGGYLTALALARNSDIFAAGADQAGVHDWATIFDPSSGVPVGTPAQRAVATAASPIGSIDTWRSPVYLDAGDDDRNVPFSQTVTLAGLLQARGHEVELHAVPDELHEYALYAHELERFTRTADFLIAHLRTPQ